MQSNFTALLSVRRWFRSRRILLSLMVVAALLLLTRLIQPASALVSPVRLLTDPFLQLPTETSVRVVWFTEFRGSEHTVSYGKPKRTVGATTRKLNRTREDQHSRVEAQTKDGQIFQRPVQRSIWRHEATIAGLKPGQHVPYQVTSGREDGKTVTSQAFTLAPKPKPNQALKILLTSDHQLKPMVPANLQKVVETVRSVDAVFFAGDLVNTPDRASEWFDDNRGNAFFPALQGRANYRLNQTRYTGGALIQSAPLYSAIGNHEVMGRFSETQSLNDQFGDAFPRSVAEQQHQKQFGKSADPDWLKNHSFNTDTYEEIFSLPESPSGGKQYYAVTFGDVRLVVLYLTNLWRTPGLDLDTKGKYQERKPDFSDPNQWGYGQHIFRSIAKSSPQYQWLNQELTSRDFQQAKYKIVMFHHPPHSLGENVVPPYADPVQRIHRNSQTQIDSIRYDYPPSEDYLIRDLTPLLDKAGVQLVFYGHSHLWNRFKSPSGMHFLETSNVGNSYGAFLGDKRRSVPKDAASSYAETGNPNGLNPIVPTISPLLDETGKSMPYVASNETTAFSIFETETGTVRSYRFDLGKPASKVIMFDEFTLKPRGFGGKTKTLRQKL